MAAMLAAAFFTQAAYAQHPQTPTVANPKEKAALEEKRAREKDADEAYKSTLSRMPDVKQNIDPWGSLRAPNASSGTK